MKRRICFALSILIFLLTCTLGNSPAKAQTINYGSIAYGTFNHGVSVYFRFDKRLTHVSNNPNTINSVAVYDTRIENNSSANVRFYFSKLYFEPLNGYIVAGKRVDRPHRYVTVRANSTKVIKNSFRDSDNAAYSAWMPHYKDQNAIQYYEHNHTYLTKVNSLNHHKYGVWPTWKWA